MCQSYTYLFLLVYVWDAKGEKIKLCLFHFFGFLHGIDPHCGLAYLALPSRRWSSPVGIPHALSCELWDNYPAGLASFPSVIIACSGNKAASSLRSIWHPQTPLTPTPKITGGKQLVSVVTSALIASMGRFNGMGEDYYFWMGSS